MFVENFKYNLKKSIIHLSMKLLKNKWFWIATLIIFLIAITLIFSLKKNPKENYIFYQVQKGDLMQTVDASGDLTSIQKVDLSFETAGTVDGISFEVGDIVESGDILAVLTATDLKAEVRASEQQLAIANAKLNQELAGATNESVAVVFSSVSVAEANLQASETDLENTKIIEKSNVSEALVTLETAKSELEDTKAKNILNLREARENYTNALKSAIIDVRGTMADADEILGVENTIINTNFYPYLSALNPNKLGFAERAFSSAQVSRDQAEEIVFELSANNTDEEIQNGALIVEGALHNTSILLLYTRQVLDATTANTIDFTTADLQGYKASIDLARNTIQTEESNFLTVKQNFLSSSLDANILENNAVNALSKAKQAYERALSNQLSNTSIADSSVTLRKAELEKAQASLGEIEANPRTVDLATFRADVARAKADLDASKARLEKAQIIAPISGRVTAVNAKVGEQVSQQTPVFVVQTTDDDQFKVVANIAESDISKVSLKDKVKITFDAFSDSSVFDGYVGAINPAQKEIEGVIYYEVDIFLNAGNLTDLKPGMTANILIETENLANAVYIPRRAILKNDNGETVVRIKDQDNYKEILVVTGLFADGGFVQILSGLNEGEEIIVSIL